MGRRTNRLLGAGVALVVVVAGLVSCAPQAVPSDWTPPVALPAGPALSTDLIAFDSDRTGNFELFTTLGSGSPDATQLTSDAAYDSWSPRLSPDRRTILFHRAPRGKHDLDHAVVSLWAVSTDGKGLVQLRPAGLDGWAQQGHAEWSPDGKSLVMFGGSRVNPQIFLTDRLGQRPRALTNRPGTNLDPSFAPDGRTVAFVGCPQAVCTEKDYEIYTIPTRGGKATRITSDGLRDHDPYWSPDGRRLAWLTAYGGPGVGVWDVQVGGARGENPTRLLGDDGVTSRPAFSPDGTHVYVHRIPPGGARFGVFRVTLGTGEVVDVTAAQPGNNEYPSA